MEQLIEFSFNIPFICIMATMASGIISNVLKPKRAFYFNLIVTTFCFILSCLLLATMIYQPREVTFMMGHFPAPWGNEIRFGPFETIMATVFSLIVILTSLAEKNRVFNKVEEGKVKLLYLMVNMLLSSTFALIYTNDLFTAYVFIEINTLCSCGLVAAKNSRKAIAATIKYLIMSLLGSGLFLISITLLYVLTGQLLMPSAFESVNALMQSGNYMMPLTIIVGLMSVAIAIKSALFPFHNWVPNAYDRAFNLSNALSSGLVLKSYIILLIKIFYRVLGLEIVSRLDILNILFIFGILSMVVASVNAMREKNIKKVLAYSSVAQIGYIYAGIGLGTTLSFAAAAYIIMAHSLVKSMLFTSCEGLMRTSDENNKLISNLKGSAHANPIAGFAFGLGALSMIGFPLLSGFFGKYLLAASSIEVSSKMMFVLAALIISTVLNAIYFLRILIVIYTKGEEKIERIPVSKNYKFAMSCFIFVNIAFGLFYQQIITIVLNGLELL